MLNEISGEFASRIIFHHYRFVQPVASSALRCEIEIWPRVAGFAQSDSETEREKIAVDFSAAPESTTVKHSERKKVHKKSSRVKNKCYLIYHLDAF